jgi:hypothetical protein
MSAGAHQRSTSSRISALPVTYPHSRASPTLKQIKLLCNHQPARKESFPEPTRPAGLPHTKATAACKLTFPGSFKHARVPCPQQGKLNVRSRLRKTECSKIVHGSDQLHFFSLNDAHHQRRFHG